MSAQIPVCCFRSQKGGVGKTTLALSVAAEYAKDGPVVVIDADILGTELADLISPDNEQKYWSLSLVDLMTGSVGGNQTFDTYLDKVIGVDPPEDLPRVRLKAGHNEIVVLPSLTPTSVKGRSDALSGIRSQFLVLNFAKEQLARRLVSLLHAILKKWKPAAIVIDNSPLVAGLGSLLSDLPHQAPVGAEEKYTLLFGGKNRNGKDITRSIDWFDLEVIGPDLQDLKAFFAGWQDWNEKLMGKPCSDGFRRGWILNKHPHLSTRAGDVTDALVGAYYCPAVAAIEDMALIRRLVRDQRVLHCNLSPFLAFGQSLRYIDRDNLESGYIGDEQDGLLPRLDAENVTDMLAASLGSLVKSCGDSNISQYVTVSHWADWLKRLQEGP